MRKCAKQWYYIFSFKNIVYSLFYALNNDVVNIYQISEPTKARKIMEGMLEDETLPGVALSARYWVERAEYEISQGSIEDSIKMLSRGVSKGAKV